MEISDIDTQLKESNTDNVSEDVQDEADDNDEEIPFKYEISSYGADYPVEVLVKKMENESIILKTAVENHEDWLIPLGFLPPP
ncbi:MAG: hypothetical protein HQK96_05260 [Nitrospirae bacterium]|nr:hypothetical protein [Nitrospirota bacterium]